MPPSHKRQCKSGGRNNRKSILSFFLTSMATAPSSLSSFPVETVAAFHHHYYAGRRHPYQLTSNPSNPTGSNNNNFHSFHLYPIHHEYSNTNTALNVVPIESSDDNNNMNNKNENQNRNPNNSTLPNVNMNLDLFTSSFPESMKLVPSDEQKLQLQDLIKSLLRRLANLSLMDYSWRSNYFKKTEADRRVEESLARMMGEDAAYVRPMDATDDTIGPLGKAEKKLVQWLSLVIEEEGRRAKAIASSDGTLVRPIDLATSNQGGPLSNLENATVAFLESIRQSELIRVQKRIFRPKDLEQDQRGPLGNAEASAVQVLDEISKSEKLRIDQSRRIGGEIV